jgi:hypothetical protein
VAMAMAAEVVVRAGCSLFWVACLCLPAYFGPPRGRRWRGSELTTGNAGAGREWGGRKPHSASGGCRCVETSLTSASAGGGPRAAVAARVDSDPPPNAITRVLCASFAVTVPPYQWLRAADMWVGESD